MRLLLLIFLLFFGYALANLAISYEEYLKLASQKGWPQNQESFNAFLDFCNNSSPSQTSDQANPDSSIFARSDCFQFASTSEIIELTTIESAIASTSKPLTDGTNMYQTELYNTFGDCNDCLKKTSIATTTPPPTTELTTFKTTSAKHPKSLSDGTNIFQTELYNSYGNCNDCSKRTSLETTTPSPTTELTTIETTIPSTPSQTTELIPTTTPVPTTFLPESTSTQTLTSEDATTSVKILKSSTTTLMTSVKTETSESTEPFVTDESKLFETSTKSGTVSAKIPLTTTTGETDVSSSSFKPTTTFEPPTTIKSSSAPQEQETTTTSKIHSSLKTSIVSSSSSSLTSAKTTKIGSTTKTTSSMTSTKIPPTTTKSTTLPSSSSSAPQNTTLKPTTPKKTETTLPELVKTTEDKSVTPSASLKSSVSNTIKTSVTTIPKHTTPETSDTTSTVAQDEIPTSISSITLTTDEKVSTTVTKDTSTMFDESPLPTISTTNKYITSTQTTADEKPASSATTNTVTTTMRTTSSKSETTTMPGHLQTDQPTPTESATYKTYPRTTPDEKAASTTLQVPPSPTEDSDFGKHETTTNNDQTSTTTSTVQKLSSTTVSEITTTTSVMDKSSPTKAQTSVDTSSSTVSPTKSSTENLKVEISTVTTTVPEISSGSSAGTTIITTTVPDTSNDENKVSSSASSSTSTTTTKMLSTKLHELETTEGVASTTESKTSNTKSTPTESTSSSTTITTTVPSRAGNENIVTSVTLSLPKTSSTLEESTSSSKASTLTVTPTTSEKSSTPTVTQTAIEDKKSSTFGDQTSTEFIETATSKIPFTTIESQTTSLKTARDKVTVSPKALTSSITSASESRQTTGTSSFEETMSSTTASGSSSSTTIADSGSSSTTPTNSKSTKKATESATQSTFQPAESAAFSSTAPSNPSTTPLKRTTTKRPTSTTTKSPICNSTCPPGFSEGDKACFKFILPNATEGAYYDDFLNACISMKGVIASLADFGNIKNVDTFQAMTNAQKPKPSMVYTNAVPTKYHRTTQIVPVVELDEYSFTKMPVIGLSATEKYPNATVICRVGKYCQEYTCPVLEYFIPPTAKYLVATVPPNTVLKANEKLNVECFGTPQRTFDVKCDERGFLLPDSSMVKCEARNEIKSEPDGPVKSCAECDKLQTTSCEPLPTGEYYCNCKELYNGRTCTYPFNACENVTCQNGGICENRFTYGFCNCETEYFGSICQYEFYNSYEAWLMRAMAYTATAVVIAETAVRTKKRMTPSAPGQFASLPTEMCKFYSAIFGSLALACRIMFEFPDSDDLAGAVQCGTTFVITMTLAFCSLTAMVAESIIALGVVINATANCYDGHYKERKKCVNNKRLVTCYALFCMIPFIIFCLFSSDMVTSRSCIGVLPWPGFPDSQQYAGLGLMVLMSAYTLTACGLALAARQVLDHNIFETRRRYEADLADPTAYGREVLPVELNVRYYLLALKPLFFTIVWFSAIAAAERMEWWATYLATICSGIYGIISFIQNKLTVYDELDGLIVKGINWLPKKFAPKYNYISNRTRNDYLKVGDPEKYAKEQEEKLNGGPAISFPIPFDQNLKRLMKTNKPGVLNKGAFFKLVPTGFYKIVIRKWKLEYLKHRAFGLTRGDSLRNVWWDIQNKKVATPMCPFTTFIDMFINFRDNCWHWDRLDDRDPRSKKVLERGVRMLGIKPSKKIPVAKVKNPATDRRVTFFRDDPLMNFDQQQKKYDLLESLCKSFTSEDMSKDEAETAAYVHKYFYYCNKRRSLLTKRINDNRRRTVHDFLLDERRPNFIGPRTFERQLPPGITYLDHTAYYWECLNYETWKRLQIRAKYVELNIELRYEYNHWGDFLPWNWSRYSWDPNMVFDPSKYSPLDLPNIAEEDENEEEDDDEDIEDAN